MSRKQLVLRGGFLCLAALLIGVLIRPDRGRGMFRKKPAPYNVVMIVVDALRADRLGAYGFQDRRISPRMDEFARRATLFEYCFAPLPMTQPSFSTLFTSIYPVSHGVMRNDVALSPKAVTLAEILRGHGWATAAVVGASNLDSVFGLNQGFDFYEDSLGRKMDPTIVRVDLMKRWERPAEEVNRLAIQWLNKQPVDRKFFLMVHYYDPHKPYSPPAPYDTMYDRVAGDKFSEANAMYDGEVTYVDAQIGKLLDDLDRRGLRNNTLILITADHGEGLGDHHWMTHIWKIYDEAVRIPLLIAGPGIPEGRRVKGLAENIDFTPTILQLLNLPLLPQFQGLSLVPAIREGKTTREYVLLAKASPPQNFKELEPEWEKFPYSQWAIRTETEKFIWSSDGKHEYYDLQKDPRELTNLFEKEHDRAMDLFRRGSMYRSRFPKLDLTSKAVRKEGGNSPDEALKALGYIN